MHAEAKMLQSDKRLVEAHKSISLELVQRRQRRFELVRLPAAYSDSDRLGNSEHFENPCVLALTDSNHWREKTDSLTLPTYSLTAYPDVRHTWKFTFFFSMANNFE